MVQGTSSSVGKSIMVAALCRIFRQDGRRVAPFKAQNMALNSFVTARGGEIGRAQAVQAAAAGVAPTVDMNPVLLKPEADSRCQLIVHGKVEATISAGDYYRHTAELLKKVAESLERLRSEYEIVVIEGAGSPAEINLRDSEIANMRIARLAAAPVLLVGDIDRGGVFASLVGTLELLPEAERGYIRGFIINKFRGDRGLLQPAIDFLEKRTSIPVLGVVPYLRDIGIAQEDSVYLDERHDDRPLADLDIAVIRLPHISNYDDFDPLEADGCRVRYVSRPDEMGRPHLIILPGTKSTMSDLEHLRRSGLAEAVLQQAAAGTPVTGICGGFQMLGRSILDPQRVESEAEGALGLGLLGVVTSFVPHKSTSQVRARVSAGRGLLAGMEGQEVVGYEIHMGQTGGKEDAGALQVIETPQGAADYRDGALNGPGTVMGTYLHGLFHNVGFRQLFLANLRRHWGLPEKGQGATAAGESPYDRLADAVRRSVDIAAVYEVLQRGTGVL
ncbi:MAG: cobyric acid synthase [Chloroflexota bacterium]